MPRFFSTRMQSRPSRRAQAAQCHATGQENIGNQSHHSSYKLQKCSVDTFYIPDKFVQENHRGIKSCRTQAKQNTYKILPATNLSEAGNQDKANRRHKKANELLLRKFSLKRIGQTRVTITGAK